MAQALGSIAEAYSMPGQKMRTGIASVTGQIDGDAGVRRRPGGAPSRPRATGVGQKIELSLLRNRWCRLMGWTFTTTMWRDRNPVTGQARITGTVRAAGHQRLVQRQGQQKPLVFQLVELDNWRDAMTACGFWDRVCAAGLRDDRQHHR